MSYIGHRDLVLAEEGFFERKDTEEAVDDSAHGFDTAFAPGPDLGGYQIHDRDALIFQFAGYAEVEIGGIGEDGEVRLSGGCCGGQVAEFAPDAGQVGEDFHQSDYGQILAADDGFYSGGAQIGTRTAEELAIWPAATEFG
jgi:hypothetical protein